MKEITLKFTDTQARVIEEYLRARYDRDKRTGLKRLCKIAVLKEARAEFEKQQGEKP